ncbi:MAG: glycosyltransferase family 2 protein [Bacteroidales bacterium]|nr:glycosyltransferase family 2 protein [Bacteroidales bacterium]
MTTPLFLYWFCFAIILYSYAGYALILLAYVTTKRRKRKPTNPQPQTHPSVTIVVAAFNEHDIVIPKVENTQQINYPANKLTQIWVTDGSTDNTLKLLSQYPNIKVIHRDERLGKAAAINHAMEHVTSDITIFSDANTMLNPNSVMELITPFANPKVGCVAGEKRIDYGYNSNASSTSEGIYWKYESLIKQLESESGSTLSAAGELFAIRTELFQKLNPNTILDDFELSTQIALNGHSVVYAKKAIATEKGSLNFEEEQKRKIRIAAGGFQMLFKHPELLNPLNNAALTFKYLSHKVLRWTLVPLAALLIPFINLWIVITHPSKPFYIISLFLLILFYIVAFYGYLIKNSSTKNHYTLLPYFATMTHISEIHGFVRYIFKEQNPKWEKAQRVI